ncbi:Receptor-like kinase [Quillaja saponaria]|uniref:Receptor-like kinase n=1 Tax=Quillaja saponaria TaxID=32244 RepID=A0AAD7PUZ2_QUISA|nr:Receptor-like kinase [Quillaja saponaria]
MASVSVTSYILFSILVSLSPVVSPATVIEDLRNLQPPSDFNSTIMTNCLNNPSLRYCNSSPINVDEIFKSTIVASHLCNESKNPNCAESFFKIDLRSRPKIAPLYLSFSFFWKYCPLNILSIDLSNNSLKGEFPIDVLLCTQIQGLDFSHNYLSGDIPVQSFSALTNLTFLNLSYNHFSESKISDTQFFKRFNSSSFIHSGLIPDHKKYKIKVVILLVGFPIFVIVMVVCLGCICFRRPDLLPRKLQRKHRFTPPMLKVATAGFAENNLVGKSDVVDIYKGILRDGTRVRIEIYRDDISRDNCKRFVEECKVLVNLRHKNLVRVLGWCKNRRLRALVTEWTEGENVEMWLSGSSPSWIKRLKVLMGVIEGMCYLQEEWPEVGYDLRTSSVLLSNDLEPLISRFKVGDQSSNTRKTLKFGVFLLEIVANRRPEEEFEEGEAGFLNFIGMYYPGNLQQVIDETMEVTEMSFEGAKQAIGLGLMCTDQSSNEKPTLGQILKMISRIYKANLVLQFENYKRPHGDRHKGDKHIQTK